MAYPPTYETGDMSKIAIDILGTGGVEFKSYISLFILGLVGTVLVGIYAKIKSRT